MLKTVTNSINASQIQTPIILPDNVTLSTGNLVIGTSGKGIDFSITSHPAGMTSELLADYEEGTWTPVVTSGSGSITTYTASGVYTKIGRMVQVSITVTVTTVGTASGGANVTLPFALGANTAMVGREVAVLGNMVQAANFAGQSSINAFDGRSTNGNFFVGGDGLTVYITGTYPV